MKKFNSVSIKTEPKNLINSFVRFVKEHLDIGQFNMLNAFCEARVVECEYSEQKIRNFLGDWTTENNIKYDMMWG